MENLPKQQESMTIRTTETERRLVRKVSSWFKCLLKMFRPCRKKKKLTGHRLFAHNSAFGGV